MQIISKPVTSFASGRKGHKPEAIVIHNLNQNGELAFERFADKNTKESMHYLICRDGSVQRLVNDSDTAWHAGGVAKPSWKLLRSDVNPNLYTIGIGHDALFGKPWSKEMYEASSKLISLISNRWGIPVDENHIIAHSQINSLNHANDPGMGVDFAKLISMSRNINEGQSKYESLKERIHTLEQTQEILLNKLSTIQLSYVAETTKNRELMQKAQIAGGSITSEASQSKVLSELLYELQQENRRLKNELKVRGSESLPKDWSIFGGKNRLSDFFRSIFK